MRILVIESDPQLAQALHMLLRTDGYQVVEAEDAEYGIDLAKVEEFDAIVVDSDLEDMPGISAVRAIRASKVATPIVLLDSSNDADHRISAYRAGGDGYLAKPFHREEMAALLQAVIRRSHGRAVSILEAGNVVIDIDAKQVRVAGAYLHLTGKEYQMLELLALRKGATVTKDGFLNHLYGGMDEPELKIIDVFICKIRAKLNAAGATCAVETVWGRGYSLKDEPTPVARRAFAAPKDSARSRLMQSLTERPATFSDLAAGIPECGLGTLRDAISWLQRREFISNNRVGEYCIYRLTDTGRRWEADRAAAVLQAAA